MQDRYHRLSELPPDVCPEGKLTREIARDPRYRMPVRVLVLDEFQEFFDLGRDVARRSPSLLVFLVKVAPGAGVSVIGATQKPSGIGTGQVAQQFTSFRDNFADPVRAAHLELAGVGDGARRQGAYSEGLDTSTLLPQYKGVGILRGASDASPTVRTYLADGQDAERILTAARELRERAGTLSGMAAGLDVPKRRPRRPRRRAGGVRQRRRAALGGPGRAARAAVPRPVDATRPPSRCRRSAARRGVPSVDVKMFGRTLKGCRRADVEPAAGQL